MKTKAAIHTLKQKQFGGNVLITFNACFENEHFRVFHVLRKNEEAYQIMALLAKKNQTWLEQLCHVLQP